MDKQPLNTTESETSMNALIERLKEAVGPGGILTGEDVKSRSDSWPPMGGCEALAIVRPANTQQVSEVLAACHEAGQPVVTLSLIHISEPTRPFTLSRMPSSA